MKIIIINISLILFILIPMDVYSQEWEQKWFKKSEDISEIICVDSINCYAFIEGDSANTKILKSTNQGDTWFKLYEKKHWPSYPFDDDDDDSVWAVEDSKVFENKYIIMSYRERPLVDVSKDSGKTFERRTFGKYSSNEWNPAELVMYNKDIGFIRTWNLFALTLDGWDTYEMVEMGEYEGSGTPAFFIDENNIAFSRRYTTYSFVKYNIKDQEWSAYGEEIIIEPSDTSKKMVDIEFINDTLIYACGFQRVSDNGSAFAKDVFWKSTDRGESWDVVYEYYKESTNGTLKLSFSNEKHGIAVGSWGKMMETFDGGDTWIYLNTPERFEKVFALIEFAGEYPLFSAGNAGINRREIVDGLDKNILDSKNIKIKQTNSNLLISIEDYKFRKYNIQIFDINGNVLKEATHRSGIGTVFRPIILDNLTNGVYFYKISTIGQIVKTGKFSVIK